MTTEVINAWKLSRKGGAVRYPLPDMSSLDAITRQLPQGFYTTFRTHNGGKRVLGLRAHLKRLYQPASTQHIDPSVPVEKLRQLLAELLHSYTSEARVRLVLTKDGQIYAAIEPLKPLQLDVYLHGVNVITTDVERQYPRQKSTSFIAESQTARKQIADSNIFEALLVRNGFILEGMTSNFFYVKAEKVGTARNDILLGVTRQTVLRVARESGLEILYRPVRREQIRSLDEAFLTSSSRGIVPIIQLDKEPVGQGRPGSITQQLMKAYRNYVVRTAEEF